MPLLLWPVESTPSIEVRVPPTWSVRVTRRKTDRSLIAYLTVGKTIPVTIRST